MCYSILRVPRFRVCSLVNAWWEGSDSVRPTCRNVSNFRVLNSSVGGRERNGSWSRRPLTTAGEGISKNSLSSAANVRLDLSNKAIVNTTTDLKKSVTDGSNADIRQLIAENKDLASLATFIVFDLETTGLDRKSERIIEIALMDLGGDEHNTFSTLVNPDRNVLNSDIHNIKTEMVRNRDVPRYFN